MDLLSFMLGKKTAGGGEASGTVNITSNGSHNVKQYATAAVSVPNTYTASDEGKIVQNGQLVTLPSASGEDF
jgi:hypothetical protein